MNNSNDLQGLSRRRFLTRVMPACSLVCLGAAGHNLWGGTPWIQQSAEKSTHKFDQEFPRKLTNRQYMDLMYGREFIPFLKLMSTEIGDDRLILMLEKHAERKGLEVGTTLAKHFKGNDFAIWKKIFQQDTPNHQASLTMSITEDTDTVHELKVTECLWADVFLKADAGVLGRAAGSCRLRRHSSRPSRHKPRQHPHTRRFVMSHGRDIFIITRNPMNRMKH